MKRRAAWLLALAVAIAAAPACDGATTEAAGTHADAAGLDAASVDAVADAADAHDAQEEPECIVHSDCVPPGGEDPKFTCRVHECVNGACEEVPVSLENDCTWQDPVSHRLWPGQCIDPGECVGCADALYGWGRRSCSENPLCCWATEVTFPDYGMPNRMLCHGTCVKGMCVEPEGGCTWY